MADRATIEARIATYMQAFTDNDRDTWVGCFAEDATLEDPVGSEALTGHEAIGGFWDNVQEMSGGQSVVEATGPIRVAGTEAAFPFRIRTGDLSMPVIDVMTFDDEGRIRSMRAFWDLADMAPVED